MALEIRNLGLKEGRIVLKDDGTFLVCEVLQQIGVWDTVANNWALPPILRDGGTRTLAQLKTFVAGLT
jgi:hypothetical protein